MDDPTTSAGAMIGDRAGLSLPAPWACLRQGRAGLQSIIRPDDQLSSWGRKRRRQQRRQKQKQKQQQQIDGWWWLSVGEG